ncbi:sister chromatid cohesion 1 protein 2 isoform X1 [Sesbania bispinosa]|nr:sister chromatid cohesion 1 protein 2 isoform X1 [Sesbania bispinosa]
MDHGKSFVVKESLEELIALSVEEQDNKDKSEFQEKNSLEDGKLGAIAAESKKLDVTSQSKFQGGLVGRPKPGATTPEFISTPAVRESAHFSRKRKYAFDEMTVLPNGSYAIV